MQNLFQISKTLLRDPAMALPAGVENALVRATIRWFEPEYAVDVSERQTLLLILKNMRRSLVADAIRQMEPWIEKSAIRRDWPEVPEYRIRRVAVRSLLTAFRDAGSIREFRRSASFYVEQALRKFGCRSPHCRCFFIDGSGRSGCVRGDGRMIG